MLGRRLIIPYFLAGVGLFAFPHALAQLSFKNNSEDAGLYRQHLYSGEIEDLVNNELPILMGGGVAAGDYDKDGDIDLYLVTGDVHPNLLLRNLGAGIFDIAPGSAGVALEGKRNMGPVFADIDGDGWLDLLVGGILNQPMTVFRNLGNGEFAEVEDAAGLVKPDQSQYDFSSSLGDPDGDGDLDLYIAHWGSSPPVNHLWSNNGQGQFEPMDDYSGINPVFEDGVWSFAPGFADLDNDGRQDMAITSDFGTSHTLMNDGPMRFKDTTTEVIDDQNGMGSALGDFDNDGDFDWFVTSIWWDDGSDGQGNRLYQNDGAGNFADVTDEAGVKAGDWGWAACAQDFNNDGWLDIFHVNGMWWDWPGVDFERDHSRLFINQQDGTFVEQSIELGIIDEGQGRGVVCFDADGDGDIDIFSANVMARSAFYRNELMSNPGWLQVQLEGEVNNPTAVGAKLELVTGVGTGSELRQIREVRVGSNYQSQDPLLQHFGLGGADKIDQLTVTWPHGGSTVLSDIEPNQKLVIQAASASPQPFYIQPGISAAWVDPTLSKEGFVIEILPGDIAVLFWFTYDDEGNQEWYIATGEIKGRRIFFDKLLSVSGVTFGVDDGEEPVVETPVGHAAFTWTSCDEGIMDWKIGEDIGHLTLSRLSSLMGAECNGAPDHEVTDMANRSGAWIDQNRDGEGYVLEILESGIAVVFYFGFDVEGNRRWLIGVGTIEDGKITFGDMQTTTGGKFNDPANDTNAVEVPWGTLELDISCTEGTGNYNSTESGFGEGSYNLQRLTSIAGLGCDS